MDRYAYWRTLFNKAMKHENPMQRNVELQMLGNWRAKAKIEARDMVLKDLAKLKEVDDTNSVG